MSSDREIAASSPKRSWQFSLGGMFVLLLGCGAAFAEWRWLGGEWKDGLSAARLGISVLLVVGLLRQAWDLYREGIATGESSATLRGARFGHNFSIGWRLAIVAALAGYHVLTHFDSAVFEDEHSGLAGWWIEIIYFLALIVIISSTRQMTARRRKKPTTLGRAACAWAVGAIYLSIVVYFTLQINFLVYIAITGIELARSPIRNPFIEGIDWNVTRRAEPVFWLGGAAALCIPPAFAALYLAFRARSSRWRWTFAAVWAAALSAMTGILSWLCLVGLPNASPLMWEQELAGNAWHFAFIAAPCVAILSLAVAFRWTAQERAVPAVSGASTNDNGGRAWYWHERPLVLLLLGGVLAADMLVSIVREFGWPRQIWEWLMYVEQLLIYGAMPAYVAAAIIALHAAYRGWRHKDVDVPRPPLLQPGRFVLAVLGFAITFLIALPVLAVYGFSLWLAEWYVPYL